MNNKKKKTKSFKPENRDNKKKPQKTIVYSSKGGQGWVRGGTNEQNLKKELTHFQI